MDDKTSTFSVSPASKRIFVADAPRTCSQLFTKLFQAHPQLGPIIHPIMLTLYGSERVSLDLKHCKAADTAAKEYAAKAALAETYDEAVTRMMRDVSAVEAQGKIPWIKDHTLCHIRRDIAIATAKSHLFPPIVDSAAYKNPTAFSDDFFASLTPIILIRHPIRMIGSFYRVQAPVFALAADDEDFRWMTTLKYSRMWFDAKFKYQDGDKRREVPIVVDAEDVVHDTERIVALLCTKLGIMENGVQYTWDALKREDRPDDPIMRGFFADIWGSKGIIRGVEPHSQIDEQEEMRVWDEEFGEEAASVLRKIVEEEMPVYTYLKAFKIGGGSTKT